MRMLVLIIFLASGASADHVWTLVSKMHELNESGDQASIAKLVPELLNEVGKPGCCGNADLAWNQLGVYYARQGDFDRAEKAFERGIRLAEKTPGHEGELSLLLLNLAELDLEIGGRPGRANAVAKRASELAAAIHGPDSPVMANFHIVSAATLQQTGDRSGARKHYENALALMSGADVISRKGIVLGSLAVMAAEDQQWNTARKDCIQAIALLTQAHGPDHPNLIRPHLNLARIHIGLKEWEPAAVHAGEARRITEQRLHVNHPDMVEILSTLSQIAKRTHRKDEAKELARRAKEIATAGFQDRRRYQMEVHAADLVK